MVIFFTVRIPLPLPSCEAGKMSLYQRARKEERVFLSLTGLRLAEFDELRPFFQAAWKEAIATAYPVNENPGVGKSRP